jgi:hypothetical protein
LEPRPRRRAAVRLAALALAAAGAVLLLGTRPIAGSAAGTPPPPSTVATAVAVSASTAAPGTTLQVTGSGFAPTLAYAVQFCPAPQCFPGDPPVTCAAPAADAQGNMACSFAVAADAAPGDWVVTVRQDVTGAAAGVACPAATPVATVAPLPTSLPSLPLPTSPTTVPLSPDGTVNPCVREASAVVTVIPAADDLYGLLPPDFSAPPEPSIAALPALPVISLPPPIAPAAPQPPAAVRPLRPVLQLRPVGSPLRDLIPGLILVAASTVVFLGSLVPAPLPPAPSGPTAGSRLRRFVAAAPRRAGGGPLPAAPPQAPPGAGASRLGSFASGQGGVGARIVRALRSLPR